jgi:hypothetical protein
MRHGLTAETFVERELVVRLAGLLWRLRRATAIETGLLQTHSKCEEIGHDHIAGKVAKVHSLQRETDVARSVQLYGRGICLLSLGVLDADAHSIPQLVSMTTHR